MAQTLWRWRFLLSTGWFVLVLVIGIPTFSGWPLLFTACAGFFLQAIVKPPVMPVRHRGNVRPLSVEETCRCGQCGYPIGDLVDETSGVETASAFLVRCPECGWTRELQRSSTTCPSCDAALPEADLVHGRVVTCAGCCASWRYRKWCW